MKTVLSVLLGLVVLLVAAVLIGPGLIDWTAHKDRITDQIENATGREVSIEGGVSLSLLPRPSFAAENVRLANLPDGSRPEMARARGVRIELDFTPLLQGNIQVREVILVEPEILLEVLPDGRRNWDFREDGGASELPVSLESFRIVRGRVTYHDAGAGVIEQITEAELDLTAESLNGPFSATGTLNLRGVGLGIEGVLGRLRRGSGTPFNVAVTMPGDDAQMRFSGTFARAVDGAADARASLRLEGGNLARSLSLAGFEGVSAALAQGYRFSSDIRLDEGNAQATDFDLRLGDTSASGALQLAFGAPMEGAARVSVQRLNLDDLVALSEEDGNSGGRWAADELTLPEWLEGTFDLDIGALIYRGQIVRQGRLRAELTAGTLHLREATALLPGGGSLALSGRAAANGNDEPAFSGRVEAGADNLRGLLDWLDVPVDDVPTPRLRRMSLLSDLHATPGQITASSVDLTIDSMKITGGVVVALRARPALGIGLSVERLNLDGYLPETATGDGGEFAGLPAVFDSFDANFDLRAGSVDYGGETARDVVVDATLQRGDLNIRRAVLGELAGSRFAFAGMLEGATGGVGEIDGTLEIETQEARELLRLIGQEELLPPGLGPISLQGALQGDLRSLGVDLRLEGLDGLATASGDLRLLAGPPEADLAVTVRHDDLAALLTRLDRAAPLDGEAVGGLDLSAQIGATALRIEADGLSGNLGPVSLSGQFAADYSEERPMVTANFEAGEIPVPLVLGLLRGDGPSPNAESGPSSDEARHWSDTPIDFSALQTVDASLTLRAGALILSSGTRVEQAAINIGLRNGVLDIERFAGRLHDGEVTISGTLDSRDTPTFGGRFRVDELESAGLSDRGLLGRISGPLDLDAQINARGASERALLRNLSGAGTVSGTLTLAGELAGEEDEAGRMLAELIGEGADAIAGVQEAGTTLTEAFAGETADLMGRFGARNGVFTTDDLTLRGPEVRAILTGEADLPRWRTETRIDFFHKDDSGEGPYMSALLNGILDQPDPTIQGGPFRPQEPEPQRVDAPAIDFDQLRREAETPPPEVQQPAVPDESLRRPSAEDIIRDLLEDLDDEGG